MNICVINGSPKGKYSATLQTVLYLQDRFTDDSFTILNAGQKIKSLEKDFSEALEAVKGADMLLFSYPVYTFIAPSQLHLFIELLKQSGAELRGKPASQITTSKHFFDMTAHRYIEDNCHDMGLNYIGGLSADMDDLLTKKGRDEASDFYKYVRFCAEKGIFKPAPKYAVKPPPDYAPSLESVEKRDGAEVVIVADMREGDDSLLGMIEDFRRALPYPTRVTNIAQYPFSGGCLGCFRCAGDGTCAYKDGFDSFLRDTIQSALAIVYAFTIRDHSMGAIFKRYDDRQFCNGHRTVTEGKPIGYIAFGDYDSEPNLRAIIEGRSEVGRNFLPGVATNAQQIKDMAQSLTYALENRLVPPRNFYGVGGMKIFRDLIWLMRGLMKADHEFYKKHGVYDFPQKQLGKMLKMKLLGALVRNPKVSAKMGNRMNEGMIAPYIKAREKAKAER